MENNKISLSKKKILDEIFYSDTFLFRGFNKFLNELKKRNIKISTKDARFYYDNQEITQLFKPVPKGNNTKILVFNPFEKVYIDTMYITSIKVSIISIIDYFTKYGKIYVIKKESVSSNDTRICIKDFDEIAQEHDYTIANVYSDNGSEMMGSFNAYLKKEGINHVFTDPYDKKQTSPIETFNRTIRLMYEKYTAVNGVNITKIYETFKLINNAYNSTVHSTTGFTPDEILKDNKKQDEFMKKQIQEKQVGTDILPLKVGSYVRLPVEKNVFSKLSSNWSKKIYKIKGYDVKHNRYVIDGIDKKYPPNLIQVIDYPNLMKNKEKDFNEKQEQLAQNISNLPDELKQLVGGFISTNEKPDIVDAVVPDKRITRGNKVNYKELAGVKERTKKTLSDKGYLKK